MKVSPFSGLVGTRLSFEVRREEVEVPAVVADARHNGSLSQPAQPIEEGHPVGDELERRSIATLKAAGREGGSATERTGAARIGKGLGSHFLPE